MSKLESPANVPVWVDYNRCKSCDICVEVCPSGTLAMRIDVNSINGKIIDIVNPQSCIGCNNCELSCPDFAIHVADRKDFKFAKLTNEAKEMAVNIKANKYMTIN
ncbi:MAG: 4Fe-4S binding protein [Helicobacteraceae bacterium]|nr:4Fe-4S binding protein [Helicobacteraceae bacterium]